MYSVNCVSKCTIVIINHIQLKISLYCHCTTTARTAALWQKTSVPSGAKQNNKVVKQWPYMKAVDALYGQFVHFGKRLTVLIFSFFFFTFLIKLMLCCKRTDTSLGMLSLTWGRYQCTAWQQRGLIYRTAHLGVNFLEGGALKSRREDEG